MTRKIATPSQKIKFALRGILLWFGLIVACASLMWGIYLGNKNQATILEAERRLFGEKRSDLPIELDAKGSLVTTSSAAQKDDTDKKPSVVDKTKSVETRAAETTNATEPSGRSQDVSATPQSETDAYNKSLVPSSTKGSESIQKTDPTPGSITYADEDDTNLANLRAVPVTKHIKLLVADGYAASQSDWIAQAVRAVSTASRIYNTEFGIELRVVGVVRWLDALPDMTNEELLNNLKKHPREGADILLGIVDKELGADSYSQGAPGSNSPYNGAYGLVGRTTASEPVFLRGVLRSVGYLLGAEQVTDIQSEAYRLGSWMSDAREPADRPPWIDMPNRKRILLRKSLPSWNPTEPVP